MVSLEEFLVQNWFGFVGIAIGVVVAVVVYYKASHVGPKLVYQLGSTRLISKDKRALPEQVEIRYRERIVPRLTKTHLALWNAGRATVKGADVVKNDQLRVVFSEEAEVLGINLSGVTREQNRFRAGSDSTPNTVILAFDYLDAGDGAFVELLHTDEETYPEVKGTVMGIPGGLQNWGKIQPTELGQGAMLRHGASLMTVVASSVLIFIGVAWAFFTPTPTAPFSGGLILLIGLSMVAWAFLTVWRSRRRIPKRMTAALRSSQLID